MNTKYIAYYRVSTTKQCLGIDAQRKKVNEYIKINNDILLNEYTDKESGKIDTRTNLILALQECRKHHATLLIAKLDRLSRKVSFLFQLRDSGINFIALDVPNFSTLTLGIFASLAQQERETISARTKAALAIKKQYTKLGAPNPHFTEEQIKNASLARTAIANDNENNKRAKLAIIALLNETSNMAFIARSLNANGFHTSRGFQFDSKSVKRLIQRYNLQA